jgi:hypothetical protein
MVKAIRVIEQKSMLVENESYYSIHLMEHKLHVSMAVESISINSFTREELTALRDRCSEVLGKDGQ